MIDINNIKSKYCVENFFIKSENCTEVLYAIINTEDLQEQWNDLSSQERYRYFTAKEEQIKIDAKELLKDTFNEIEEHEELNENCSEDMVNSLTDEKVDKLQAVLDEITSHSVFTVFLSDEKINPDIDYKGE